MKALVTGAGGTIGSILCGRLIERGDGVRALFLPGEARPGIEGLEAVTGDVTKPETLAGLAEGVDKVFHLAARVADWGRMGLFYDIAVRGTENMLRECVGKVERFVYMSSIAAYGVGRPIRGYDEDGPQLICGVPYADTKIEAEAVVKGYCFGTDTSYTIVRPSNVLGPKSVWVGDVIDAYLRGPVPLCDGGRHPTAFVYVDNLVDGILLAADGDAGRDRIYHFMDDYDVTWKEYLQELGALVGKKPAFSLPSKVLYRLGHLAELAYLPFFPARPPLSRMAVAVMGFDNEVDMTRAGEELGWKTRVIYGEAMEIVKAWVREAYGV